MDDYRQTLSYMTREHGRFGVIVYRTQQTGMGDHERAWLKEMYSEHNRLIFTLPVVLLQKGISKIRNPSRFDWIEKQLSRRMDTFQRSYLKMQHARGGPRGA